MPVYEYECANGHRTEVMRGIDAPDPERCPVCGAALHRILSRPAIVFKGSGWAKKDRRAAAARPSTGEKSPASTGAADGSTSEGGAVATPGSASTAATVVDGPAKAGQDSTGTEKSAGGEGSPGPAEDARPRDAGRRESGDRAASSRTGGSRPSGELA